MADDTQQIEEKDFKFYPNFLRAIDILPEEKRAKACYEFCKFGITGILPEDESLAMFCIGVSASVQKFQGRGGVREGAGRKPNNQKNQNNQKIQNNQNNQNIHNEQTETETETKTETEAKTETETKINDCFLEFYSLYPRKEAKQKALLAYKKAIKTVDKDTILEGLNKYIQHIEANKIERRYIKQPASWLNGGCWEDEYSVIGNSSRTILDEIMIQRGKQYD